MSDQKLLDKNGLDYLIDKIKTADKNISTTKNTTEIETHLSSYYYIPCSSSDTDAYEVYDDKGNSWGYWKYIDIKSGRTIGSTPVLIRDIELTPSTTASSDRYNQNNGDWIRRYTFNGKFLSRPVFINKVMKNGVEAKDSPIKTETYIYTPDHIMTVGSGHQLMMIKSNHAGGIFFNNWDAGTFVTHKKLQIYPQSTMWRVVTANYYQDTALQRELYGYFKCSWDTGSSWSSNYSYSFGGKMFITGDFGGIAKGELILTENGIRLNVFNGYDSISNNGVYEVNVGKEVPSKYNGIAIVDGSTCTLYTSHGSYKLTKLSKSDDNGFYIDEFKEAIEEIYIEPYKEWYESEVKVNGETLLKNCNFNSFKNTQVSFSQYRGANNDVLVDEVDDSGNLTGYKTSKSPTSQYISILTFNGDEKYNLTGVFTDFSGDTKSNDVISGWVYDIGMYAKKLNKEDAEKTNPKIVGKIYIKFKPTNQPFYKNTYNILSTYDWFDVNNSPSIKNYINSNKCLNEVASNAIKELYIEKLKFDDTNLVTAWKEGPIATAQYMSFTLQRVDKSYNTGGNGVIFYLRIRQNNVNYNGHIYLKLTKEYDNIYVLEGTPNITGQYTKIYIENETDYKNQQSNIDGGLYKKITNTDKESPYPAWYIVSEGTSEKTKKASFKIYMVLNPSYIPPHGTNEQGKRTDSYVIMEKACNITNSPTIQSYLTTKKLIEESKK